MPESLRSSAEARSLAGAKSRSIKDTTAKVGDYIYVHGKIASDGDEKVVDADSIDVITAGWGIVE